MKFILGIFLALVLLPTAAFADADACPRPAAGSEVTQPPDLYSQAGVLNVTLGYYTSVDALQRTLFCFVTDDGKESPTLHVKPGDTINITLTNMLTAMPGAPTMRVSSSRRRTSPTSSAKFFASRSPSTTPCRSC